MRIQIIIKAIANKAPWLVIILFAIMIECMVFNFRFWQSLTYSSYDILSENSYDLDDDQYVEDGDIIIPFREDGTADFSAFTGNLKVQNLYVKCNYIWTWQADFEDSKVSLKVKASDEGNANLYEMNSYERTVSTDIARSSYISLNPSGNLKELVLTFENPSPYYYGIRITEISFNKTVPFSFSVFRFLALCMILSLIYAIRPKSEFYLWKLKENRKFKKLASVIVFMISICFALFCANINKQYNSIENYRTEYHDLAEALLNGHVWLDIEPAESLSEMDNPYDTVQRDKVMSENGEYYYLDYAYYDGRYYCYFGILPVLLTLLPYYALTGTHMPISIAISIFGLMYAIGSFLAIREMFSRWFQKVSYVYVLSGYLLMMFATGTFYAFRGPGFYALPNITAAAFAIFGLWFWFCAEKYKGRKAFYSNILAGSLFISLTAAARPQFLIAGIVVFPLFWNDVIRGGTKAKNKFKLIASLLLPAIVIAAGVMYYNYIRFGSLIDFGAAYNLTGNDMTHRGWHFDRVFLGLFVYLFIPPVFTAVFPFMKDSLAPQGNFLHFTNYMGTTTIEGNCGGLIFNHIILLAPFFAFKVKKYFQKQVFYICQLLLCASVIVVIVDTQMAGLVARYSMDFGWLMCLSTLMVLGSVENNADDLTLKYFLRAGVCISIIWGIMYEFLMFFNDVQNTNIKAYMPGLYYYVESLVEFWL